MTKIISGMVNSSKTTIAGVLAAALVIGQQILNGLDASPATAFDANLVLAQLAILYGFIMARDNDKSSEQVGAK